MHTAHQLKTEFFEVTRHGQPSSREEFFPDWGLHERLAVIMTEPFGAVGASHLIQMSITAFYDARPTRRAGRRDGKDPRSVYPEIFLFHVGGRFGDFSWFDFRPLRKEVFLEADPRIVLDALNDRGITRLAVPDKDPVPVVHEWKEPAAARDRMVSAWVYSADARVRDPEWMIKGLGPSTERNAKMTLDPAKRYASLGVESGHPEHQHDDPVLIERDYALVCERRLDEGVEGLPLANERREAVRENGLGSETYRSISIDDALEMLV